MQYQKTDLQALLADRQAACQKFDWETLNSPPPLLTIQAPMVRCSRPPFRRVCRLYGTDISYSHMIMADSFTRSDEARQADFAGYFGESRLVVQLAGTDPEAVGEAAVLLSPYCDAFDINCGCPQKWAMKEGIGAAMMTKPQLVHDIVRSVYRKSGTPCVVKMRVFDDPQRTVDFAQQVQAAGSAWLTVHGRTWDDNPSAPLRFETIETVRQSLQVPLVVNGCIDSLVSAYETSRKCKVGSVMSARALLSNPALFDRSPSSYSPLPVPPEAVCDFMRLSVVWNANVVTTRHHLLLMLHQMLTPSERLFISQQQSLIGIVRCLKESGYWTDCGRFVV